MTQKLHTDTIGNGFFVQLVVYIFDKLGPFGPGKKNYILKHLVFNYIFDELSKTFFGGKCHCQ